MKNLVLILVSIFWCQISLFSQPVSCLDEDFKAGCILDCGTSSTLSQIAGSVVSNGCITGVVFQGVGGNYTISDDMLIKGTLIVDVDLTVNNATLFMAPGSKIILPSEVSFNPIFTNDCNPNQQCDASVELTLNNALIRGCEQMWKGIELNNGLNPFFGPAIFANQSEIRDANIAISFGPTAAIENRLFLDDLTFFNNYIGIKMEQELLSSHYVIKNSFFSGDLQTPLLPPYSGQDIEGNSAFIGILLDRMYEDNSELNLVDSDFNTFLNLKYGIYNNGFQDLNLSNQKFYSCQNAGVFSTAGMNIQILDSHFEDCQEGVTFEKNQVGGIVDIGLIPGQNKFICNTNCISAIKIEDCIHQSFARVINNQIDGNFEEGIIIRKLNTSINLNCTFNTIKETVNPILVDRVRSRMGNFLNQNSISNLTSLTNTGILLNHTNLGIVRTNDINVNNQNSRYTGISVQNKSRNSFLYDNFVTSDAGHSGIKLRSSSYNRLCCNSSEGLGLGLYLEGTNTGTDIKNTTFEENDFELNQTEIGPQIHHGNRWFGEQTNATLTHSNIGVAVDENLMIINLSESNTSDGQVRPQEILPTAIENDWFFNDPTGNSNLCGDTNYNFCEEDGDESSDLPDIFTFDPGPCFPADVDKDGDGICDSVDPDPLNPCIPNSSDLDNDGLCDGIDPSPADPCIPFGTDSDGDGLCDLGEDFDFDPCLPNGSDLDGDELCDQFDPFPSNASLPYALPPNLPTTMLDINGDLFHCDGLLDSVTLRFNVTRLEAIALDTIGTHPYEYLNHWESNFELLRFLINNPIYLRISPILLQYYNGQLNTEIWEYV